MAYLQSLATLNPAALLNALPGAVSQGLIWGIMAIGVFITYKVLDFADLTVDGSICTGAAACTMVILSGHSVWLGMLAAVVAGMLAGLCTGLLHTALGIPPILSGILTQMALWSINLGIMGQANQAVSATKYSLLVSLGKVTSDNFIETPMFVVSLFVIVCIVILYWFFGTEQGAALRATGANPHMSRAQGINTNFTTVVGLVISNGLVGLAGALLAQYQGFTDIKMGAGAIVIGLAAVIIGSALFDRFFHNFALRLLGVVLGAIIYYLVLQFVLWLKLDANYLKLLSSTVVALFLGIPYWRSKSTKRHLKGDKRNA